MRIVKAVILIAIFAAISGAGVFFIYQDDLDKASRPIKVVTPENYTDAVLTEIELGDTVRIAGTPDLLLQVSQERDIVDEETGDEEETIDYHYVGLKEYGYDFVVRLLPGKLNSDLQTFEGTVTGLTKTDFGSRILKSINKPLNFEESVNEDASREIDEESQKQIQAKSTGSFSTSTLLVLDGESVDQDELYAKIGLWTVIATLFLVTLFRKTVFTLHRN